MNCQPSSEPQQDITISAMTTFAYRRREHSGQTPDQTAPWSSPDPCSAMGPGNHVSRNDIDDRRAPAYRPVPRWGRSFSGFSTTSALAQADSSPRNAHNVMAMEEPTALKNGTWCGFHDATYMLGLKPEPANDGIASVNRNDDAPNGNATGSVR